MINMQLSITVQQANSLIAKNKMTRQIVSWTAGKQASQHALYGICEDLLKSGKLKPIDLSGYEMPDDAERLDLCPSETVLEYVKLSSMHVGLARRLLGDDAYAYALDNCVMLSNMQDIIVLPAHRHDPLTMNMKSNEFWDILEPLLEQGQKYQVIYRIGRKTESSVLEDGILNHFWGIEETLEDFVCRVELGIREGTVSVYKI